MPNNAKLTFKMDKSITPRQYMETLGVFHYYAGQAKFLASLINKNGMRGKCKILDVGCGIGTLLSKINSSFPGFYSIATGIDQNKAFIEYCRNLELPNAKFYKTKFEDFKPVEKYDIVLFTAYISQSSENLVEFRRFIKSAFGMLTDNGMVIFSFIDSIMYANKYDYGAFKLRMPDGSNFIANGLAEPGKNNKLIFELTFTNRKTGYMITSKAQYIYLTRKKIKHMFDGSYSVKFKSGHKNGLPDDKTAYWCILKRL
jgi:2-polyprenyl-3-methyl-5-hydroxy-6-metoxy-1,4-benzoquinol methylase